MVDFQVLLKHTNAGWFFVGGLHNFSGFLYLVHIVVFQGVTARKYLVLIHFKYLSSFMLQFYIVANVYFLFLLFLLFFLRRWSDPDPSEPDSESEYRLLELLFLGFFLLLLLLRRRRRWSFSYESSEAPAE